MHGLKLAVPPQTHFTENPYFYITSRAVVGIGTQPTTPIHFPPQSISIIVPDAVDVSVAISRSFPARRRIVTWH